MGDFDYSTKPQMPQFREEGGGWDWRQLADMLIPGNVWNSRTNQYRPLGIAQGLTGIPVDTMYGAARNAGSFLGRIGRGVGDLFGGRSSTGSNRDWMGPTRGGVPFLGRGPTIPDFAGQDIWGTRRPETPPPDFAGQDIWGARGETHNPSWRMPEGRDSGPSPMRGGQGGYNGMSWSSARGLGQSQRRTEDQIMQEQMDLLERMRDRHGLMQER